MFWEAVHWSALYSCNSVGQLKKQMIKSNTAETHSSSISKIGAYVNHYAIQPLSNITGGYLSDYMQLLKTSKLTNVGNVRS